MKDLITVSLLLGLIFGVCFGFFYYSSQEIDRLNEEIQNSILPAIKAENWKESQTLMNTFHKTWDNLYHISLYFRDTSQLNDINICVFRTIEYIQAQDRSNASGEIQAVSCQLSFLQNQEKLTPQNIF